jgi:uncharacterized protein YidB (DUF937 family)
MGLLDNVLGELAGGGNTGSPLQAVIGALLAGQSGQQNGQQGGLGGLLGSLQGGQGGSQIGGQGGGLAGLIGQFEQAGLGHLAQSWVGTGPNQPVSPQQVETALGPDQVQGMADQTGMQKQDLLSQLAQALPGIIDRLTPNGRVPSAQEMQGGGGNTIEV